MSRVSCIFPPKCQKTLALQCYQQQTIAGAGKNIKADLETGMQDANAKTRAKTETNFDKAAAQGQQAYDSAAAKGSNIAQKTADKLDTSK